MVEVKKIRKELGLTQKEFADMIGIAQSYLSELETKRRDISKETLKKLHESLGEDIISRYTTTNPNVIASGNNSAASVNSWAIGGGINLPSTPENGSQKIINENGIEITCESWPREHARLTGEINDLKKEVEYLQKDNKRLEEINDLLKLQIETLKNNAV